MPQYRFTSTLLPVLSIAAVLITLFNVAYARAATTDLVITDYPFRFSTVSTTSTAVINEFVANHVGTDTEEYIELFGAPSTDLAAYRVLEIEGDSGASAGVIDGVFIPGVTDANGFYLLTLNTDDLENGTVTLLLVEGFTGNLNQDLDADNLGGFDVTPWAAILDSVTVNDGGAGDQSYSSVVLTANYDGLPFTPGGASRIPNGTDTDTIGDWMRNDFDLAGIPGFTGTPQAGEALNTPGATNQVVSDTPPTVTSTAPGNGTTAVPANSNIVINFSEAVDVTGAGVTVECPAGTQVSVTGLPADNAASLSLDPTSELPPNVTCTVTVIANQVTDNDGTAEPLAANYIFSFTTTEPVAACSAADTPIGQIQGTGNSFAVGGVQTVQGVVVGDYEYPGGDQNESLRGFYLQNLPENDDDNDATSDGMFIFNSNNNNVSTGQIVQVTGNVSEFDNQTQITATALESCGTGSLNPVGLLLPLAAPVSGVAYLEHFEGMLVQLPQTLYVTEHFQLVRFGHVVVSSNKRLYQPTSQLAPGGPGSPRDLAQQANDLNRILIDDGTLLQNPDPIVLARGGNPLSAGNTLRGGDTATGIIGVLTFTRNGEAGDSTNTATTFRVRPIGALNGTVSFQPTSPRPATAPAVGGTLRVAAMNLLNFFNTFDGLPDTVDNCTFGVGGAPADCRGADTQAEFDRQWPKTVAAILGTGADIIGINEIENDGYGPTSAIQFLVDQLNAATAPGTYAFIDVDAATGQVNAQGTDAIKVGLLYKPTTVTPVGQTAALNTVAFVNGGDSGPRSRPSLAQAFQENATGARFVVDVNHLKSKGSACDAPDAGDGQGNCNIVRKNAATELVAWLASDPTGTGESDVLILGDLNSYAMEDPITVIQNAGYTNLIASSLGPDAYSYVFDGQWGYLDHALGSASLLSQVAGVGDWHINADEPSVLDYNTDFKSAGQISSLYAADQFRISDHDPVIVGLNLNAPPTCANASPSSVTLWPANHQFVPISVLNVIDPEGDPLSMTIDSIFQDEPVNAPGSGNTSPDGQGVGTATAQVRAERVGSGNGRVYHIHFTAADGYGGSCSGEVLVTVPHNKKDTAIDEGPLYDSTVSVASASEAQETNVIFLPLVSR